MSPVASAQFPLVSVSLLTLSSRCPKKPGGGRLLPHIVCEPRILLIHSNTCQPGRSPSILNRTVVHPHRLARQEAGCDVLHRGEVVTDASPDDRPSRCAPRSCILFWDEEHC
jgi:hypothetical protein